jgi:hypothetical protein
MHSSNLLQFVAPFICCLSSPPPSACRDLFQPIPDLLQVDVVLGEGCMPPMVLMIAAQKAGKALLSNQPGIKDYAKSVQVGVVLATGGLGMGLRGWALGVGTLHLCSVT